MENFELTNAQREYFGLEPIDGVWERVQWRDTSYIFFDGDTIRKIIHYDPHPNFHTGYIERDYDLQTENRELIKPKTAKGKPKKVTASNILAFKPINVSFSWQHRDIRVKCEANEIVIAKTYPDELRFDNDAKIDSFERLEAWVKDFIANVPENYFEKLQAIKNAPKLKKNTSYKRGDIFSYQSGKGKFCFGQVLLDLWKVSNCGKFPEEKILSKIGSVRLFGNPLIVRGFNFVSATPEADGAALSQSGSSGGFYSIDYMIYENICPVVGHSKIEEKDMLFPMILCAKSEETEDIIFQWGFIEKKIDITPLIPLIERSKYEIRYVGSISYHSAIIAPKDDGFHMINDLNHPDNRELKEEVFKIMGVALDITYNQFAEKENELTIGQIFERLQ